MEWYLWRDMKGFHHGILVFDMLLSIFLPGLVWAHVG
jgi:hypothetical protein